ncbi:hypothetical protein [Sediminibacterium sp.]|uniref:phosphoribosyltransferase-like protein n=1 Tax=Sediminibacterium sp. TaxID=1917865 RepID=UPI0027358DFF|nr:hypothetical protein [Sediminibacterium sp.]MDP3392536.1 hypothetical protein [Sediminibacterium sp.]MDP3565802.1 hypothetical protein [Sediminibacterium sp.]
MKIEIAEALLQKVLEKSTITEDRIDEYRKYFQRMAKYKYDNYEQYGAGMRFIEKLALWLDGMEDADKETALEFIKNRVVFISALEMRLLVEACYPDLIKDILIDTINIQNSYPSYTLNKVINSQEYKMLLRRSLFFGMSDGARIDEFRRANTGKISHEQIYQTYELSEVRAEKMQKELIQDFPGLFGREAKEGEDKFQRLFLLDDFSASGTSYLKYDKEKDKLKGKIAGLYESVFSKDSKLSKIFDIDNLKVYVIIYLCTQQAKNAIESNFDILEAKYGHRPQLLTMHTIPQSFALDPSSDQDKLICEICMKDQYYDPKLQNKHTDQGGTDVKMGFGGCGLPLILHHNTPNNSVPILWSYENSKFEGLFPRIPRHIVL